MAKLIVLYKTPADAAAFDKYYRDTHVGIAKKIPGLRAYELSKGPVAGSAGGSGDPSRRDPDLRQSRGSPFGACEPGRPGRRSGRQEVCDRRGRRAHIRHHRRLIGKHASLTRRPRAAFITTSARRSAASGTPAFAAARGLELERGGSASAALRSAASRSGVNSVCGTTSAAPARRAARRWPPDPGRAHADTAPASTAGRSRRVRSPSRRRRGRRRDAPRRCGPADRRRTRRSRPESPAARRPPRPRAVLAARLQVSRIRAARRARAARTRPGRPRP